MLNVERAFLYSTVPYFFIVPYLMHWQIGVVPEWVPLACLAVAFLEAFPLLAVHFTTRFWVRGCARLALLGACVIAGPTLDASPVSTFLFFVVAAIHLFFVNSLPPPPMWRPSESKRKKSAQASAWISSATTALLVFLVVITGAAIDLYVFWAAGVALGLNAACLIGAGFNGSPRWKNYILSLAALPGWGAALLFITINRPGLALTMAGFPALVSSCMPSRESERGSFINAVLDHPARWMVFSFLFAAIVGTALLALPFSSASGKSIGFIDAAFTSISAVCVTGLIVLDTPNDFTLFGQMVILVLIQIGGLGIMTFYAAALRFLRKRPRLSSESTIADLSGHEDRTQLFSTIKLTIVVTFVAEFIGAVILLIAFLGHQDSFLEATWRGIFTSISAFCNAGFALQSDSLIPYQKDFVVLLSVALLIIIGGLSPLVVSEIITYPRYKHFSLRSKMALFVSLILLVIGFGATFLFERQHALVSLGFWDSVVNAFFQSATLRTAGFNSFSYDHLTDASVSLMVIWMFIGGSPGGTAGGIKTTTLFVLFAAVSSTVYSRPDAEAFGRTIPRDVVYRAAAIATSGIMVFALLLLSIQLTQNLSFRTAIFEVTSALGTVGLSLGGTGLLDNLGKVLIAIGMFIGRIGPLTGFLLFSRRGSGIQMNYPEERVLLG